jgi:molybdenum cofactor synthesis domain-containing protein
MKESTAGKASILAVGTELTTGQITNRNAAWISEQLVNLGIEVVLHETVSDERSHIQHALQHCSSLSQFIFVTGGLGPTTDDFTREVIASWLNQKLEFDEPSWQRIVDRLNQFGIPVAESNRQQCYFPTGSQIIPNPNGTASGFTHLISGPAPDAIQQIWVLPGPPHEVSAVWEQGIAEMVRKLCNKTQPSRLFTWQCMGKSEAELGEITEKALAGSQLQTGYRAHRPFVEVKVWCPENLVKKKMTWIQNLEKAISPWIFTKQGEDLAAKLLQQLNRSDSIEILDAASGGLLGTRLGTLLRKPQYQIQAEAIALGTEWSTPFSPEEWISQVLQQGDNLSITLAVAGIDREGQAIIGLREGHRFDKEIVTVPFKNHKHPELLDRNRAWIVEMALKKWSDWLILSTH